jgi:hypothetical protein
VTSDEYIATENDEIVLNSPSTTCTQVEDEQEIDDEFRQKEQQSPHQQLQPLKHYSICRIWQHILSLKMRIACVRLLDKITQVISKDYIAEKNSMHQTNIHPNVVIRNYSIWFSVWRNFSYTCNKFP